MIGTSSYALLWAALTSGFVEMDIETAISWTLALVGALNGRGLRDCVVFHLKCFSLHTCHELKRETALV